MNSEVVNHSWPALLFAMFCTFVTAAVASTLGGGGGAFLAAVITGPFFGGVAVLWGAETAWLKRKAREASAPEGGPIKAQIIHTPQKATARTS